MNWSDEAIVLSVRRHGESGIIAQLLTREHGLHAGLVHGGAGRRARGMYQPGNRVSAQWRARLSEHLGSFTCELLDSNAAELMDDAGLLAGLSAACAMAESALPEREPHAPVFLGFLGLIDALRAAPRSSPRSSPRLSPRLSPQSSDNSIASGSAGGDPAPGWTEAYVKWELGLLTELGFGLDLTKCAATGSPDNLAFVSPKSGGAVSLAAGEEYRDRLLVLPRFLHGGGVPNANDIGDGLALTGYFLERHVFRPYNRGLPPARLRLADRFTGRKN